MFSVLFGADAAGAQALAAPLRAGGYNPEVRVLEGDVASDADLATTRGATIVFLELALGTSAIETLRREIRARAEDVPPLLAILGEPSEHDADRLIAAGANMYFPAAPDKLALRTRFLHQAVKGRAQVARSLAELRASEARARAIEHEFRVTLEGSPNPVFVHRHGKIVWADALGAELLGFPSADALVGVAVLDLVPPPSRAMIEQRLRDRAVGKSSPPFAQTIVRPDGTEVYVWVVGMPTVFEGAPAGIAFVRDLTEQRRLETQLAANDRLASLGRLAASVGHEINNPLTYVLGNLELATRALRKSAADPKLVETLEQALVGAEHVKRIVNDLRVFSQGKVDVLAAVDVGAVVDACIRMTTGELRHRARVVRAIADVPAVWANEPRLAQVITNLLLNAAQALPEGATDRHAVTIAARRDGAYVEIAVEDTGEGIAPEHLPHVFEPFFTTKSDRGGTGLGLAICKMLVASQDGELAIASTPGTGTRVAVRIPIAVTRVEPAPAPEVIDGTVVRRVLIVDDNAMVTDILARSLVPHHVATAGSGRDALARLERGERFDAILCDLMMPDLGGDDVYDQIRARYPGLERRIVFMTGGAFTPRATGFLERIENPCLAKPFDLARVLDEIERAASR